MYGEEEYLADAPPAVDELGGTSNPQADGSPGAAAGIHAISTTHTTPAGGAELRSQSGRLLGMGVLAGISVGALLLVVSNVLHRSPAVPHSTASQSATAHVRTRAGRRVSTESTSSAATTSIHASSAVERPAVGRSHIRAATSLRSRSLAPARPRAGGQQLATVRSQHAAKSLVAQIPAQQISTRASSWPSAAVSPLAGEFDFER